MALHQMSPVSTAQNERHGGRGDTELLRNGRLSSGLGHDPNGTNIRFAEFCPSAADAMGLPALGYRVSHVVSPRSQKQMVGVDAGPHVAFVANIHARRNWAAMRHPRQPMRVECRAANTHGPVSSREQCESPKAAAAVWFRDGAFFELAPKSRVVQGFVSHLIAVLSRSVVRVAAVLQARLRPAFSSKNCGWVEV